MTDCVWWREAGEEEGGSWKDREIERRGYSGSQLAEVSLLSTPVISPRQGCWVGLCWVRAKERQEGRARKWIKKNLKKKKADSSGSSRSTGFGELQRHSQTNNLPPSPRLLSFLPPPPLLEEKLEDNPLPWLWGLALKDEADRPVPE